jgi:hypothetical protein
MHDESSYNPARKYDEAERNVLYLLTEPDDCQPLWSAEDIGREIESDEPTTPIHGLLRAGLIHRTTDGFVFASRAGVRMGEPFRKGDMLRVQMRVVQTQRGNKLHVERTVLKVLHHFPREIQTQIEPGE